MRNMSSSNILLYFEFSFVIFLCYEIFSLELYDSMKKKRFNDIMVTTNNEQKFIQLRKYSCCIWEKGGN